MVPLATRGKPEPFRVSHEREHAFGPWLPLQDPENASPPLSPGDPVVFKSVPPPKGLAEGG